MKQKIIFWLYIILWGSVQFAFANNIQVSNVGIAAQNTSAGVNHPANFSLVQFTVGWENSWRISTGPANWDAAWVFVKFRVGASNPTFSDVTLNNASATVTLSSVANLRVGMPVRVSSGGSTLPAGTVITAINPSANQITLNANATTTASDNILEFMRIWEHARLNTTGHTAPGGGIIDVPTDGTGAFIYRGSDGNGPISFTNAQLRWNYGTNGLSDNEVVSVQVFAIEMVYVPGGVEFNVGGGGGSAAFTSTTINTANATTIPSGTGRLGGAAGGYPTGLATPPTNANWPNGYNAFYCMKYEISQGQYRDFLNTLTRTQQANRVTMDGVVGRYAGGFIWTTSTSSWSTSEVSNRTTPGNRIGLRLVVDPGGISPRTYACDLSASSTLPTGVNQSNDGEWNAMGQLSWMDGCAYMDWAGLRPMTEMEFEKACRGNQSPVSGEYAWGTTVITAATGISNGGAHNETFTNAGANAVNGDVSGVQGPLRVGAFSDAASTRELAGATYYGIMEMSGNLWERTVTISSSAGLIFTGGHGDGALSNNGHATVAFWPGIVNGEIIGATGAGFRGGDWNNAATTLRLSDREEATTVLTNRRSDFGFRGVRTAL